MPLFHSTKRFTVRLFWLLSAFAVYKVYIGVTYIQKTFAHEYQNTVQENDVLYSSENPLKQTTKIDDFRLLVMGSSDGAQKMEPEDHVNPKPTVHVTPLPSIHDDRPLPNVAYNKPILVILTIIEVVQV
ncbi:hypothetical protein ScPMuIL_011421 [Solemya velum]